VPNFMFLQTKGNTHMVPSLARQAIIIKCKNDTSVITGNYELAYALGFIVNQTGILFPGDYENMKDLQIKVMAALENRELTDERLQRLHHMLQYYKPTDDWDEQMGELINMGLGEQYPWDMFRT
jgi:hypothetical protein